ncbi:PKD domain-containing protein [Streptomyces avidinii]
MRNRRLVVSVAAIAAGVGLIPGVAQADPAKPDARGASTPDLDLGKAAVSQAKGHTFTSPAERTVRKALPSAKTGTADAPAVQSAADNPNLSVGLSGYGTSAHGIEVKSTLTSVSTPLEVTIDWGDQKTDVVNAYGSQVLTNGHTYAEVGAYTVTVTVKDAANGVTAVNVLQAVTPGSDFTPVHPDPSAGHPIRDRRDAGQGRPGQVHPCEGRRQRQDPRRGHRGGPQRHRHQHHRQRFHHGLPRGHHPARHLQRQPDKAGQTVPNLVIVPVGKSGYVELSNRGQQVGRPDRRRHRLLQPVRLQRLHPRRPDPLRRHP